MAALAQLVELRFCKPTVAGSTPVSSSTAWFPSGQREQTVNLPAYAFGGSNPSLPTRCECSSMVEPQPSKLVMSVRSRSLARVAYVAQSVEHFLGKEEVTGSNPVVGSPKNNRKVKK